MLNSYLKHRNDADLVTMDGSYTFENLKGKDLDHFLSAVGLEIAHMDNRDPYKNGDITGLLKHIIYNSNDAYIKKVRETNSEKQLDYIARTIQLRFYEGDYSYSRLGRSKKKSRYPTADHEKIYQDLENGVMD